MKERYVIEVRLANGSADRNEGGLLLTLGQSRIRMRTHWHLSVTLEV